MTPRRRRTKPAALIRKMQAVLKKTVSMGQAPAAARRSGNVARPS